ncbi:MAG: class II aldolase/adducin family protein [Planctomycetaceae bacterium]|nr:class II aldolase/adducin family protein [Planctomycetaceae bacterium]
MSDSQGVAVSTKAPDDDVKRRVLELADTPEARELKFKLAAAYRMLADRGLDEGVAGHISLRVPGAPDHFWVNPFGVLFEEITADQLVIVNEKGQIVDGWPLINRAGFMIHSAIHQARPDVNCAVHSHSPAGSAFSSLGVELKMLDQVTCSFFEDHSVYNEYEGVVVNEQMAGGIVKAVGNNRACILVNHGLITCASTIEQAMTDFIDLERSCEINLRALATGQPLVEVPPLAARQVKSIYVTDRRWPFMWQAYIRQLSRRTQTEFAPISWGGVAGVPTTEMVRMNLLQMMK